jgi:hypothetical protein
LEDIPGIEGNTLKYYPYKFKKNTTKFDLVIYFSEFKNNIMINCTYRTGLFDRSTIEYIMGEYMRLMGEIVLNPGKQLKYYDVFSRKRIRRNVQRIQIYR